MSFPMSKTQHLSVAPRCSLLLLVGLSDRYSIGKLRCQHSSATFHKCEQISSAADPEFTGTQALIWDDCQTS